MVRNAVLESKKPAREQLNLPNGTMSAPRHREWRLEVLEGRAATSGVFRTATVRSSCISLPLALVLNGKCYSPSAIAIESFQKR